MEQVANSLIETGRAIARQSRAAAAALARPPFREQQIRSNTQASSFLAIETRMYFGWRLMGLSLFVRTSLLFVACIEQVSYNVIMGILEAY